MTFPPFRSPRLFDPFDFVFSVCGPSFLSICATFIRTFAHVADILLASPRTLSRLSSPGHGKRPAAAPRRTTSSSQHTAARQLQPGSPATTRARAGSQATRPPSNSTDARMRARSMPARVPAAYRTARADDGDARNSHAPSDAAVPVRYNVEPGAVPSSEAPPKHTRSVSEVFEGMHLEVLPGKSTTSQADGTASYESASTSTTPAAETAARSAASAFAYAGGRPPRRFSNGMQAPPHRWQTVAHAIEVIFLPPPQMNFSICTHTTCNLDSSGGSGDSDASFFCKHYYSTNDCVLLCTTTGRGFHGSSCLSQHS